MQELRKQDGAVSSSESKANVVASDLKAMWEEMDIRGIKKAEALGARNEMEACINMRWAMEPLYEELLRSSKHKTFDKLAAFRRDILSLSDFPNVEQGWRYWIKIKLDKIPPSGIDDLFREHQSIHQIITESRNVLAEQVKDVVVPSELLDDGKQQEAAQGKKVPSTQRKRKARVAKHSKQSKQSKHSNTSTRKKKSKSN